MKKPVKINSYESAKLPANLKIHLFNYLKHIMLKIELLLCIGMKFNDFW